MNLLAKNIINIMKRLPAILALLMIFSAAEAQNTFKLSGGMRLVTTGGVQLVLGGGNITNDGTISSTGTGSSWIFKGPVIVSGTGVTTLSNLVINHTYGITQLNAPVSIANTAN